MHDNNDLAALSNVAIIRGAVHGEPKPRDLPSGGVVVQFDVATRLQADGHDIKVSVPIAWHDPTSSQLASVLAGAEVVVVGTVQRRFFRVGGATQSRTEVIADEVVPSRRRKGVAAALRGVADRLLAAPV